MRRVVLKKRMIISPDGCFPLPLRLEMKNLISIDEGAAAPA